MNRRRFACRVAGLAVAVVTASSGVYWQLFVAPKIEARRAADDDVRRGTAVVYFVDARVGDESCWTYWRLDPDIGVAHQELCGHISFRDEVYYRAYTSRVREKLAGQHSIHQTLRNLDAQQINAIHKASGWHHVVSGQATKCGSLLLSKDLLGWNVGFRDSQMITLGSETCEILDDPGFPDYIFIRNSKSAAFVFGRDGALVCSIHCELPPTN